jgi:hypothetical protein
VSSYSIEGELVVVVDDDERSGGDVAVMAALVPDTAASGIA